MDTSLSEPDNDHAAQTAMSGGQSLALWREMRLEGCLQTSSMQVFELIFLRTKCAEEQANVSYLQRDSLSQGQTNMSSADLCCSTPLPASFICVGTLLNAQHPRVVDDAACAAYRSKKMILISIWNISANCVL